MASLILSERRDGVAFVSLNRPDKRNALSRELITELIDVLREISNDRSTRVLLLSGEGTVFCAGMDLGQMQARASSPNAQVEWEQDTRVYRDLLWLLFSLPIPTVAVLPGPALAGGLGIVLACDIVLASESAFFSLPEPKRGITAAVVTPYLHYRVGAGVASYLLLSGTTVSARQAQQWGLCHEVVPEGEVREQAERLARDILSGAPHALAVTKWHLIQSAGARLQDDLETAQRVSAEARESDDAREGLAAFLEKRPPAWSPPPP